MRVLVADAQAAVRSALRRFLFEEPEFQMVGEAAEIEELLVQAEEGRPDLVLLDWELPGLSPIHVSKRTASPNVRTRQSHSLDSLHTLHSRPKIVVLCERPEVLLVAFAAGADAFVCKADPPEQLLKTLYAFKPDDGG